MQSQWHNCPTINGHQQHEGSQYTAHNITFANLSDGFEFSADIANAYPKEAAVRSWRRKFAFNGTQNALNLTEHYELSEFKEPFSLNFVTVLNITNNGNNEISLNGQKFKVIIEYPSNMFDMKIESKETNDYKLGLNWGKSVNRLILKSKSELLVNQYYINFKAMQIN